MSEDEKGREKTMATQRRLPSDSEKPNRRLMTKLSLGVDFSVEFDNPTETFEIVDHWMERSKEERADSDRPGYQVLIFQFPGGPRKSRGQFFIHTTAKAIVRLMKDVPRRTVLAGRIVRLHGEGPNAHPDGFFKLIDPEV